VAQLTDDPHQAIRDRVEQALAADEVNLASPEGRDRTQHVIDQVLRDHAADALNGQANGLTQEDRDQLARELRDDFIGLGALAERMLADPTAQEWMINAPKRVFRDTGERIERVPTIAFHDDRQVRAFLDRLLEQVEGKRLDRITPRVEARLPDGSRLTAAIPPVSSNGHAICSIRRFRLAVGDLQQLVELEFLAQHAADFLTACVHAGKSIVVSGRVSSGKTTLLNALGHAIPGTQRVVVCESSAELHLPATLPNCIGYEARPPSNDGLPAITLEDLVSDALRMNPDRIIVGDLANLTRFALTSGARIEPTQALDWLRDIDIVVHCDRPRAHHHNTERRYEPRRIDQIVELTGIEGQRPTLNPLYQGAGPTLAWTGTGPSFLPELQDAGFEVPA
jgi:Flp pilus assembly CpaF family ATPase